MVPSPTSLEPLLVGQDTSALVPAPGEGRVLVHREMAGALAELRDAAARAGFQLEAVSGHRDFSRQLAIWNAKARGERPVLDAQERPVDVRSLSPEERVHTLLRWSALPGASRHHWGTDVDVFDRAALPPGEGPRLVAEESNPGGPFAPMHAWLDANLHRFGFFRPYAEDRGGVGPERWHLSYAPLSLPLQRAHSPGLLARVLDGAGLELRDEVLRLLPSLWERYVINVSPPPAAA